MIAKDGLKSQKNLINFNEVIKPKDHRHKDFIHHNFIFAGEYCAFRYIYDFTYLGINFRKKILYAPYKHHDRLKSIDTIINQHLTNHKKSKKLRDNILKINSKHNIIFSENIGMDCIKPNINFH